LVREAVGATAGRLRGLVTFFKHAGGERKSSRVRRKRGGKGRRKRKEKKPGAYESGGAGALNAGVNAHGIEHLQELTGRQKGEGGGKT